MSNKINRLSNCRHRAEEFPDINTSFTVLTPSCSDDQNATHTTILCLMFCIYIMVMKAEPWDVSHVGLQKLERKLKKVNDTMRGDARVSSDPILKLMYGDPRMFLSSLPQQSVLHSSAVWSCREKGSLLSLTHIVEQNDGKDYFPLLWRFLQKVICIFISVLL